MSLEEVTGIAGNNNDGHPVTKTDVTQPIKDAEPAKKS
jgi:hypothetical protein